MGDPREGKVLQGRYRILSLLAEGGMGVVYKGERVGIGRPVVVKFLHAVLSDKPGIVDRFEREARATARLNHPNCVALVDFGIDDGAPYLVVEYVEGQTLADLLDHGAVRPERAVHIARQILAGLEHAHDRGILHRDLKPANVMIVSVEGYAGDFVKILDFGLAKLAVPGEDKRDVTVEGIAIGTPGYMSPEQAAGVPSDRRSDIYCTGALLYHLVTGTKAFEGDDVRSVLRRHREETPASPREIKAAAGISRQLEAIIERAMQRDPGKRFQSAREMCEALDVTPEARRKVDATATAMTRGRSATPTPADDATRADGPGSRARLRRSAGAQAGWIAVGVLVGSAAAVAAVAFSPLGDLVRPRVPVVAMAPPGSARPAMASGRTISHAAATAPAPRPETAAPVPSPAVAPSAPVTAPSAPPSGASARPTAPAETTDEATRADTENAARPPEAAAPAAPAAHDGGSTTAADKDDDDDEADAKDDGSNENDRTPPPEPAAVPRRDAPAVRSLADVRALLRKGDSDGALAGLFRLRRSRQPAAKASEIARLIGDLYFERKWWTDGLREYRFAIALDAHARKSATLVNNSVHALGERNTYLRARRLILDYIGRSAAPALRRAARAGNPPALRRRAQKLLATVDSRSYRMRHH